MSQIAERVIKIVSEQLSVEENRVVPEATFAGDLGADSLDSVELMMELEEKFGIEIPDEKAQAIVKVQDAIDYVSAQVAVES